MKVRPASLRVIVFFLTISIWEALQKTSLCPWELGI
jgi:hypothetical protein